MTMDEENRDLMDLAVRRSLALSPQQRSLWPRVGQPVQAILFLRGNLDPRTLRQAIALTVARHEILRTGFPPMSDSGTALQVVTDEAWEGPWREIDLRGRSAGAREEEIEALLCAERRAFAERATAPWLGACLAHLASGEHALLLTLSALCADRATLGGLPREIAAAYGAALRGEPLPAAPVQYRHFAAWQNQAASDEETEVGRAYWRAIDLSPARDLALPFERRSAQEPSPASVLREIPWDGLGTVAGVSLEAFVLAAWQALLARLTGAAAVVVGAVCRGRDQEVFHGIPGRFSRCLPVNGRMTPGLRFSELAWQTEQVLAEGRDWQDLFPAQDGFLFPWSFDFEEAPEEGRVDGLMISCGKSLGESPGLELLASRIGTRLRLVLSYDAARLDPAAAERLAGQLATLLRCAAAAPASLIEDLDLLSPEERQDLVVAFNRTARELLPVDGVHRLIAAQARRTPHALAAVCGEERLTYAELAYRARRLAHHLRRLGAGPEARVALFLERSLDVVVALLAVLEAGGAYVPLDPGQPRERLSALLEEAGPAVVVSHTSLAAALPEGVTAPLLLLDRNHAGIEGEPEGESDEDPAVPVAPEGLAYVLFTSGSTGRPKGVAIGHHQLLSYTMGVLERLDLPPGARFAMVSTFAADLGNTAIFPALCTGGTLHVLTEAEAADPQALAACFERHAIDAVKIVPSHLTALLAHPEPQRVLPRRLLVLGGEAAGWALIDRVRSLAPGCTVLNHYGPTETTVGVLTWRIDGEEDRCSATVPLGRPIANTRAYVLDGAMRPLAAGMTGELHIAGHGLARGYFGRPDQTAERFVPDPFADIPGGRLYRTGDLARFLPGGEIEFLGRRDHQVKIRGFRVELGEIEAILESHAGVHEAVVTVDERSGRRQLAAYVVTRERYDLTAAALRRWVRERLPEVMCPAAYVFLKALPLTANGKIDRRALPPLDTAAEDRFVAPRTPVESTLARIWGEVLALDRVGVHDNFFDVGGDSIVSIQVIARTNEAGLPFTPRQLFQHQTIAELAALLEGAPLAPGQDLPAGSAQEDSVYPASPMQRSMLFLAQLDAAAGIYLDQAVYTLRGSLDAAAFRRAWETVVARHPALRTGFRQNGTEEPLQVVEPQPELPWSEEDWRGLAPENQRERLEARLAEDRRRGFDLGRAPLLRLALIRTEDAVHRVVWTFHHIVLDGWSVARVLGEVALVYRALARGGEARLEPACPYGDYIHWLEKQDFETGRALWTQALRGFTSPTPLPFRPGTALAVGGESSPHLEMAARLGDGPTVRLQTWARRQRLTLNTLLQGAWGLLLHRISGEPDVVFGATVSGRPPELGGVESMVGLFINTLPVRARIDPGAPLHAWLRTLQEEQAELRLHQHAPLIEVQGWSEVPRGLPLFESLVVFDNFPMDEVVGDLGPNLEVDPDFHFFNRTNFALSLASWPALELPLELRWDSGRFELPTIQRLLGHLISLLEAMTAQPEARLSELWLLREAEVHQILAEWNDTAAPCDSGRSFVAAIEERVAAQPEAVALVFGSEVRSYREIEEEANRIAWQLRSLGMGRGDLVAVHLHRSAEMVPALLGILKSGAAYVPLEVSLPPARVRWLLAALEIRCIVTQRRCAGALAGLNLPALEHLVLVDRYEPAAPGGLRLWGDESRRGFPSTPPPFGPGPEDLAYIIFTSGSTGTPKGVMVRHQPVLNLIEWVNARFQMGPEDRVLFITALSFDLSVYDIFGLLVAGGSIRVAAEEELSDPASLVRALEEEPITYWDSAPAALQQLVPFFSLARGRSRLRLVFLSGDWVPLSLPSQVREAFPAARVVALGGATEATVWSNFFPVTEVEPGWVSIPYGRPIQNARYHVLDGHLDPCPIGVAGDLYIGGECLALGYAQEPGLTAWKFVPDGCGGAPGGRLYRTGDRARFWNNGLLEFLGRLDNQVKVRGFRIELGEIEAALGDHPEVRDAVVLVREDRPGDRRLVAYVVPRQEAGLETGVLRADLRERLPEHMVPTAFVLLDAMPVTANGKLDRKALPAPEPAGAEEGGEHAAPRNPTEEILAGIWAEVLGLDRVGIHDNFFALGGHSLIATRLVARVREALGVELSLRRLFDAPTVAVVAEAVISGLQAGSGLTVPALVRIPRDGDLPLSFAQERLWFLDRLDPGNLAYNVHAALHLAGPLDLPALAATLGEIVRRHEVLRTTFRSEAGLPVPVIHPPEPFELAVMDLSGLPSKVRAAAVSRLAREEARRPFDLEAGPLLRVRLLRLADQEHIALITVHHIVSDGWSTQVFLREMAELYRAFAASLPSRLPELPIQYVDFAACQRSWLQGEILERQLAWWRERLAGVPAVLDLPTDRPRSAVPSLEGEAERLALSPGLAAALTEWSRRQGATLFMTLLATFEALLARVCGQPVVAVGTPIAGRHHVATEGLIGFFVNTLVMRGDLEGEPGLRELVGRVREMALGAQAHQDMPFEKLVGELQPERSLGHTPLFQVMFALENAGGVPSLELPGLTLQALEGEVEVTKFDLTLSLVEAGGRIGGTLRYRTALFDRPTVARLGGHWLRLVEQSLADPERPLPHLPLLGEAERHQLTAEWNDSGSPPPWGLCVHQLFERQAAATPDAPALVCEDRQLTYTELDRLANRLAHRLRRLGVGLETVAGILIEPSIEMIVAMLAIHKAGGGYLGLDLALPGERLAFLLADAHVPVVVTRESLAERLDALGVTVVRIDAEDEGLDAESTIAPVSGATPDHLAYIIYTSGSTGQPKGVAGQHAQLLAYLHGILERLGPPAGASFALQQSLAVDAPITYLFASLCYGGVLHLIAPDRLGDPEALADLLGRRQVDYLKIAPSHLAALMASGHGARMLPRRLLLVGGEASSWDRVRVLREMAPHCTYLNHYGPTETTVGVLTYRADHVPSAPPSNTLPLGRPLAGARVYVLDSFSQPLPIGVTGELYIGGGSLARGYVGRPDLTAARFVPDPFAGRPGSRLYRTGDLTRALPDGTIEFLGRVDHQVKVRGFRVELEEIEAALSEHPDVVAAVVLAWRDAAEINRLVGYVIPAAEPSPTTTELRRFLGEKLPEHMVPSAFVFLERLPRTPQGKVDRRALPAPERVRPELEGGFVAPRTPDEERMASLWSEVLEVEKVGVRDNFFDLGGHSLRATLLIARVCELFAVELPLRALFEAPTVEGLLEAIERERADSRSQAQSRIAPVDRESRRRKLPG